MLRTAGAVFLALLAMLAVAPLAHAEDPIQILDIDTYERTLAPGQRTVLNWTVRNIDVVAYDIAIRAGGASGWNITVTPPLVQALPPNRAAAISVEVVAPSRVSAETTLGLQVLFTVYQDGAVVFIASRTATLTVPSVYAEKRILGVFPNPLPPPLDNEWGVFLLDIAIWLMIAVASLLLLLPFLKKIGTLTKAPVAGAALRIIRMPLLVLLFLYGAIQSLSALDRHVDPSVREGALTIYRIALIVILFYVAYKLFRDVAIRTAKAAAKRTKTGVAQTLVSLVEKVGLVVIGVAGLSLLLGYLSIDLTLLIAGGVVTSMVIAFAAQDTLSNFFSGIFLLAERPFKEGDLVILSDGDWTEVRRIGMRTTQLFRFSDGSIITLPNSRLVNEKVANFSNPYDKGRIMKTFSVGYGSDIAQVKRILREVLAGNPHILQEDPSRPIVRFDAMGESSLDFFVLVWIDDRANRFDVQDYLNTEIYNRFNEAGIEIPFPQRTVHLAPAGADAGERKPVPAEIDRLAAEAEAPAQEGQRAAEPSRGRRRGSERDHRA